VSLAIFDLDNTLIGGDSDYLWGEFLVEQGLVGDSFYSENQRFYEAYKNGTLDIYEFLEFSLKPLSQHDMPTLTSLHRQFMVKKIQPILLPAARSLLQTHRENGDTLLIITATNRFVTAPIAAALQVQHLLATNPQIKDGRYTGKVEGIPCFKEGKVQRLQQWLLENQLSMDNSWFYSDSHNDIPLLDHVTHAIAVDPDPELQRYAEEKHWKIMSLR